MLTLLFVLLLLLYLKWIVFVLMLPVIRLVRSRSRKRSVTLANAEAVLNSTTPPPKQCKEETWGYRAT